jgi:3-isopropylmalate dehydratase, small subunit
MKPFDNLTAIAAPLPLENVDTDKILAGRFLKTISREGLGKVLFHVMREDPDFVLNRAPWDRAGILIALDNFGCGSSREHAPWALLDFGFRCIIAPSFADIFYNNCFKNGILPIVLARDIIEQLIGEAQHPGGMAMTVDLACQTISLPDGEVIRFDVDPHRKADLIAGVDEIARSLAYDDQIDVVEASRSTSTQWITPISASRLHDGSPL